MSNLAVVVYASDYTNISKLPGCERDALAIETLLLKSGQFDDTVIINGNSKTYVVKERIVETIKSRSGANIDTIFFYFTGHGCFKDGEFYYLLSDYSDKNLRTTSIENSELDQWLRSLAPKLCVKVVDACQSGVPYIKDASEINSLISKARDSFSKIYFMFSSQSNQSSYATERMSEFTASFVRATIKDQSNGIRYKDLIDAISDEFSGNGDQTPTFVAQADFTEIFLPVTEALQKAVMAFADPGASLDPKIGTGETLVQRILADAKRYVDREKAMAVISDLAVHFAGIKLPAELSELFEIVVSREDKYPSETATIGTWLQKNKEASTLFAKPETRSEAFEERVRKRNVFAIATGLYMDEEDDANFKTVTRYRDIVTGFKHTTEMPYAALKVRLQPTSPNVSPEECYIVPLLSLTEMRLFYGFAHFDTVDWGRYQRSGRIGWQTAQCSLSDTAAITKFNGHDRWRFLDVCT